VTSSLAVFEAAIRVKSTHTDKIMFENQKKDTYENIDILNKSPSKRLFRHRFHILLRRDDATRNVDIIYRF